MYSGNVKNKIQMGVANTACDDAVNNLELDWRDNPVNYTCYHPTTPLLSTSYTSDVTCDNVPNGYNPQHFCMNQPLSYDNLIPSFGDHRPMWAKFGEYK